MNDTLRVIFEIFISWFPMLILIVLWIYYARKSGTMKLGDYLSNHLEETRKTNDKLERIASSLETLKSKKN